MSRSSASPPSSSAATSSRAATASSPNVRASREHADLSAIAPARRRCCAPSWRSRSTHRGRRPRRPRCAPAMPALCRAGPGPRRRAAACARRGSPRRPTACRRRSSSRSAGSCTITAGPSPERNAGMDIRGHRGGRALAVAQVRGWGGRLPGLAGGFGACSLMTNGVDFTPTSSRPSTAGSSEPTPSSGPTTTKVTTTDARARSSPWAGSSRTPRSSGPRWSGGVAAPEHLATMGG